MLTLSTCRHHQKAAPEHVLMWQRLPITVLSATVHLMSVLPFCRSMTAWLAARCQPIPHRDRMRNSTQDEQNSAVCGCGWQQQAPEEQRRVTSSAITVCRGSAEGAVCRTVPPVVHGATCPLALARDHAHIHRSYMPVYIDHTGSPLHAVCAMMSPRVAQPGGHAHVHIRPSARTTPPGLIAYVLAQLSERAEPSHSVHASRPLKRGQVVMLYRGHVITSEEETAFERSMPPYGVRSDPAGPHTKKRERRL